MSGLAPLARPLIAGMVGALLLSGCRCGGAGREAPDAGTSTSAATTPQDQPPVGTVMGIDLRSALILIHPEFRYARVSGERTGVQREITLTSESSLKDALEPSLLEKKFQNVREEDGVVKAEQPPLQFEARRGEGEAKGEVTMALFLPLDSDTVLKLLHSPTTMGSEHFSAMMPMPVDGTFEREHFFMRMRYGARPDHASFLVRRLVEGMLGVGWNVEDGEAPKWEANLEDGGLDTLPHELDLVLVQPHTGGRLTIDRRVGRVILDYVQPLARGR